MRIGVIGNGSVGGRLAALLTASGHDVLAGERNPTDNQPSYNDAATHGEVVILAVPFTALETLLPSLSNSLRGKTVVDATNPLNADWSPWVLEGGLSAGEQVQQWLPNSQVVKAFNTIFADAMGRRTTGSGEPATTAFLCGESEEARATIAALAKDMGFVPMDAGPLRCARYLEAMAHLNIQLAVGMGGGTQAIFHYHYPTDFIEAS